MSVFSGQQKDLESLRPELTAQAEVITFTDQITFLKHKDHHTFIKLAPLELSLIKQFNGSATLADILKTQLEASGTTNFQKIFDIILELNSKGFLYGEVSAALKPPGLEVTATSKLMHFGDFLQRISNFTILKVPFKFNTPLLQFFARSLLSPLFISLFAILSILSVVFWPDYEGYNVFQGISVSPGASLSVQYGAYFISIFSLWLVFSLVISLRNILTAYALTSLKCEPIKPGVRFFYGLLIFDLDSVDIVRSGPKDVIRLYVIRMLFPLLLVGLLSLFWEYVTKQPFIILFKHASLIIAFFSISPLFPSDFSRIFTLIKPGLKGNWQCLRFLGKRFLPELLNFKEKTQGSDFFIVMSVLSIGWLFLFYTFFWSLIESSLLYLVSDLLSGLIWGRLFILGYMVIILLPFIGLFLSSVLIAGVNVHSLIRAPLHRMTTLASQITRRKVPPREQVIAFLKEIPLLSRLRDDELKLLCDHLHLKRYAARRNIILQGQKGASFFMLVSGRVSVIIEDNLGDSRIIDKLGIGDCFGEIALIENVPRTASIRTLEPTVVFELEKSFFDEFVIKSEEAKTRITDIIRNGKLLLGIPAFSSLSPRQISTMAISLMPQPVAEGEVIFSQGQKGDRFYIIRNGSVRIEHKGMDGKLTCKTLGKGDFFGEIALVKNIPRTATAIAGPGTQLVYLERDEFRSIIQHNLFAGIQLDSVSQGRLSQLGKGIETSC